MATRPNKSIAANSPAIPQFVRADFAHAINVVLWGMAATMALAAVVALLGLRRGVHVAASRQRGSSVADTTKPA